VVRLGNEIVIFGIVFGIVGMIIQRTMQNE
jgi:hypothetical protein